MIQWDYKVTDEFDWNNVCHLDDYLREHGADGWELVAISHNTHSRFPVMIFKRPIPQPSTAEKIFNETEKDVEMHRT